MNHDPPPTTMSPNTGGRRRAEAKRRAGVSGVLGDVVAPHFHVPCEAKESDAEFDANVQGQLRAIAFADVHASVPYRNCKITGYAPFTFYERMNQGAMLSDDEPSMPSWTA